jgi:methyl-accepting chemotaxis protein
MLKKYSIRIKVTATLSALLLLFLLIEVFYLAPYVKENHINEVRNAQVALSEQIGSGLDFSFSQAKLELENVAKLAPVVSMEKDKLDAILTQYNRTTWFYGSYYALNKDGVWISHPRSPERVGKAPSGRWINETVRENRTVTLDVIVTSPDHRLLVSGFATPIRSEGGEVVGILRGSIIISDKDSIVRTVNRSRVGKSGYAYIVSSKGRLITHPEFDLKPEDHEKYDYSDYEPVKRALLGEDGITEYEYGGQMWLAAYKKMDSTGWGIVVQQPMEDILATASEEANIFRLIIIATFVGAGLIFIFVFNLALKPFINIIETIRSDRLELLRDIPDNEAGIIAKEFYSLYSELSISRDELGKLHGELEQKVQARTDELSKANAMLQAEILERKNAEAEIYAIYNAISDLVTVQDTDYRILSYNRTVEDHLPGMCGQEGDRVKGAGFDPADRA